MMRIRLLILAATALLSACASLPRPSPASVAVRVAFDRDRITGVSARGAGADDPVRVASISKLITALGVMRLVEAGTLDLDSDVSRWLGWSLHNPNFPDRPITLRLLLSHRSSLKDDVDYAIPLGKTIREALADPKAWDAEHPPGSFFRYGNINFPVVASVMEAATGERFDALMARLVFEPLAIDACFNWTTCSDTAVAHAVVLRDGHGAVVRDDLNGTRPDCPVLSPDPACDLTRYVPGSNGALFSPQGGARISAAGLARIGQMLLKDGDGFLSPASVALLIGPEWRFDGRNGETEKGYYCTYGLAVHSLATPGCRDDPFGDGIRRVGHSGDAYGLRSGLWIDRQSGRGVAYFVTAVPDNAPKGRSAFTAAEEALAR
ncbi:putative hydrolase [Sphingomonas changbaiensis NBRC 104936]|uniref:Putative hydrolase n=1 Tax=Sphingomonas changbaiensis NBRC 104936 TaxID=1219043 RepID=A0A0E9MQH0_9SPHN|nr:serine hydrolase [Sphingomonas changbaiensis]GAO40007.1 putative hydrolase [Sphingomonas changbaiensis NBRC 104936]